MAVIMQTTELTLMNCGECGVPFAIPEFMRAEKQESGGSWFCPNGHGRGYSVTDAERYRKERDAAIRARDAARIAAEAAQDQAKAAKRDAAALKGQLTRTRKRIANGVCPCCHRTFTSSRLARHIATKHPDYADQPVIT
jgi:hypothetical protein